jgi:hypothetical protein
MNPHPPDRPIGRRLFTDGAERPVFEDANGRQYVLDDGEPVEGVWLPPAGDPLVVESRPASEPAAAPRKVRSCWSAGSVEVEWPA